jgi:hypothetical protein
MFNYPIINFNEINYDDIIYDKNNNKLLYKYNKTLSSEVIDNLIILFDYDYIYAKQFINDDKYIRYFYNNDLDGDLFVNLLNKFKITENNIKIYDMNLNNIPLEENDYHTSVNCYIRTNKNSVLTLHPSKKSGLKKITTSDIEEIKDNIIKYYSKIIFKKDNNCIQAKTIVKPYVYLYKYPQYDEVGEKISSELNTEPYIRFIDFNIIKADIKFALSYTNDEVDKNIYYEDNKINEVSI